MGAANDNNFSFSAFLSTKIMTEKNKWINSRNVSLPFPYPMLQNSEDGGTSKPIWPFKDEGFVLINGTIDAEEKVVLVKDAGAIFALNKMGFFGFNSSKEVNQMYIVEQMIRKAAAATRQQQKQQKEPQPEKSEETEREERQTFKAGFYTLETIDIPPACTRFEHDANRSELKQPQQQQQQQQQQGTQRSSGDDSTTEANLPTLTSLKLCFEEAYFLSYAFGLLSIAKEAAGSSADQHCYGLLDLWKRLSELYQPDDHSAFAARYAAYHYLRSKGWIVRNGFKFGTDYLLYREGPPFAHALYSVMVRSQVEGGEESPVPFMWNEISGLTRVSRNAHKKLMICLVSVPRALLAEVATSGPQCIRHFTVDCIHVNRWNSSKGSEPFDISQLFSGDSSSSS